MKNKYIYFILIALCFLVYANSLNNAFVSDDIPAILKNPSIALPFSYTFDPATFLNSLGYLMAKDNPLAYHLISIILHSINTIFVFLFLNNLFFSRTPPKTLGGIPPVTPMADSAKGGEAGKTQASLLGACLFAVHPIHAESVSWISGKPYLITALFIFITYFLYQNAASSNTGASKTKEFKLPHYLICLVIFSYSMMIPNPAFYFMFPLFLILSDVTSGKWRKRWKLWVPFLGILIFRLLLARNLIAWRISSVAKEMGAEVTWSNPFFNLVYSVFSHFWLLIWPAKLTLYHEPAVISAFALRVGMAALLILAFALPFIFKKSREIFFAIAVFILFLIPTYSPVMISWLVAERYVYFPSIILSIFIAFFYERYVSPTRNMEKKNLWLGFLVFIIAGYAARTVARNEDWKTPERFWRQTLLVSYNSPRSHNNMGDVYSQEGNTAGAISEFSKAIELKPDYADAYHNLATTYYRMGNLQETIKLYEQAVSFNPELFESHYNLGIIYLDTGKVDLAIKILQRATELRPQDSNVKQALEMAMRRKG